MAESFGDLLRRFRIAAGLTQQELAERSALSVRAIQSLETGVRRMPQRNTVQLLVDGLGLTDAEQATLEDVARRRPRTTHPAQGNVAPRTNLPQDAALFVGREREVQAVRRKLLEPQTRLLTLTGPGGAGKTRLALHVARLLFSAFPQGVYLVSLAPIDDPALVPATIAQALGVVETPSQSLMESLTTRLGDGATLLVLDNFEQILEAAPLVAALLAACGSLKVLVTSRAVLHVQGERKFDVASLEKPDLRRLPALDLLSRYGAVELFVQRAQDVYANFALTADNAAAVAEICVRLDGLPLALELAAARSNVLTPQALLQRLRDPVEDDWRTRQLDLLTGGAQDMPVRQRTIRATIEWSHTLLPASKRILFRRLGAFVGGWTLEAAEAVCAPDGELNVLDGMSSLVDTSLVRQMGESGGELRFGMLETVREYARERLADVGDVAVSGRELDRIRQHHAAYYLDLAERADLELRGAEQVRWLDRLEAEHDNLRAALVWALSQTAQQGGVDPALRLVEALGRFWFLRGHFTEWDYWLQAVLMHPGACDPAMAALRAKVLLERGMLALYVNDSSRASDLGAESLRLFQSLGDRWGCAAALVVATVAQSGRIVQLEEAVGLARELGDPWLMAWTLHWLGHMVDEWEHDHERAEALVRESLALAQQTGDEWLIGRALISLGQIARAAYDMARAEALFQESLLRNRHVCDQLGIAWALEGLGIAAFERGSYAEARAYEEQRLEIEQNLGNRRGVNWALYWLARIALEEGDLEQARSLSERSLTVARSIDAVRNVASALQMLARILLLWGDAEAAFPLLCESLDLSRGRDLSMSEIDALIGLGWADIGTGAYEQAEARLARALEDAEARSYATGYCGALEALAAAAAGQHQAERAAQLFGLANARRQAADCRSHPTDRALAACTLMALEAILGKERFDVEWRVGQNATLGNSYLRI